MVGGFLVFTYPKGEVLTIINERHTTFGNLLFTYATYLGDFLFAIIIVLLLTLRRYGDSVAAFTCFAVTGLLTVFFKRIVFAGYERPKLFFKEMFETFNIVEGVKIYSMHSFPSGHTSVAFAVFCFLAMRSPNKPLGMLFFTLALLTGISRIYLLQHFFIDVYFGALLGTFMTMLIYTLFISSNFYNHTGWVNRSLFDTLGLRKNLP